MSYKPIGNSNTRGRSFAARASSGFDPTTDIAAKRLCLR
jgi:hypothetical protein